MQEKKHNRVEEIIHRLAAQFIQEISTKDSLVTVTRVELSPTGKESRIYFTTLPEKSEKTVEKFLERKTPEFIEFMRENSKIGFLPSFKFMVDYGERNRQRLDELTS